MFVQNCLQCGRSHCDCVSEDTADPGRGTAVTTAVPPITFPSVHVGGRTFLAKLTVFYSCLQKLLQIAMILQQRSFGVISYFFLLGFDHPALFLQRFMLVGAQK